MYPAIFESAPKTLLSSICACSLEVVGGRVRISFCDVGAGLSYTQCKCLRRITRAREGKSERRPRGWRVRAVVWCVAAALHAVQRPRRLSSCRIPPSGAAGLLYCRERVCAHWRGVCRGGGQAPWLRNSQQRDRRHAAIIVANERGPAPRIYSVPFSEGGGPQEQLIGNFSAGRKTTRAGRGKAGT